MDGGLIFVALSGVVNVPAPVISYESGHPCSMPCVHITPLSMEISLIFTPLFLNPWTMLHLKKDPVSQ